MVWMPSDVTVTLIVNLKWFVTNKLPFLLLETRVDVLSNAA